MSIKIKQHDIRDCGAACLASISSHYKLDFPIARIRQVAGTDQKGTNVLGMIKAAESLGFDAKGFKTEISALEEIPLPCIIHLVRDDGVHHYVVLYGKKRKKYKIMDPEDGKIHFYTENEFSRQWSGILILLTPGQTFKSGNFKVSVYQRFWELVKPHKTVLFQALFGAILYTALGLSTAIYLEKITDFVIVGGNKKLLNLLSVIMIFILFFRVFLNWYRSIFVLKVGQNIDSQLILGYYKHLLSLPQRFFDTMSIGEITSRINDAVKIRVFINNTAVDFLVNILILIFSFVLMASYYWKLALIISFILPLYIGIYGVMNFLNKKTERKQMEKTANLESQLVESISSIRTIKQFRIEEYTNQKTESRFVDLLKTVYTSGVNTIFSNNSTQFLSTLFTIILLWVGSFYVIEREITPGELLSFYSLIGYFTAPMIAIIGMNKTIQNAIIAADRLFEIIDLEREGSGSKLELLREDISDIEFKNVSFSYGTRKRIFESLSLHIPKGKITAIVGESGSGKTTLISLLQNLYELEDGKIMIGDFDLNHCSNDSLRNLVSVVPQKLDLFSGTIIENLALGDSNPDFKRILEICKDLGINDFIEELPEGFESKVGEDGALLSGGQRQRLAIARALYKNPEVLILDEATSSLDSESESRIQEAIKRLRECNKTIIIIAHRLSTVAMADKIIVLENGKLIEEGSHNDLLNKKGSYANLWRKQTIVN